MITMVVMVMLMMMAMICSSVVLRIRVDVASRGLFGDQVYSATELSLEFLKYFTNNFFSHTFQILTLQGIGYWIVEQLNTNSSFDEQPSNVHNGVCKELESQPRSTICYHGQCPLDTLGTNGIKRPELKHCNAVHTISDVVMGQRS